MCLQKDNTSFTRQPAGRYTGSAGRISNSSLGGGYVSFAVDPYPSGGALLANLIQNPSLGKNPTGWINWLHNPWSWFYNHGICYI